MPSITSAASSVKAIFALDIITSALALIFFLIAVSLVIIRLKNNRVWRDANREPFTHLFLIPALFCLCVAYATLAGVVARQVNANTPVSITPPFSHSYPGSVSDPITGRTASILSYTNALATVFSSVGLTGAVWLHSVNLKNNGTGASSPGIPSRLWNAFVLTTMLALGVASWGRGMSVRNNDIYSTTLLKDLTTRALYIAYRVWVIFSSTSVTFQVIANYLNLKKNSGPRNLERPMLTRFTFVVVPIIWLRNVFTILDIVLLYVNTSSWSGTTDSAVAFLLIIFRQFANLTVLATVLFGAWKVGKSAGRSRREYSETQSSYEA